MKKLLKILTPMAAILSAALFFAGCKQFLEDPEDFFQLLGCGSRYRPEYRDKSGSLLCARFEYSLCAVCRPRNGYDESA